MRVIRACLNMKQAPGFPCSAVLWLAAWLQVLCGLPAVVAADQASSFTRDELTGILRHGPWPPPRVRDSSNQVSGNVQAIAFGERLFFDARLSLNGNIA